MGKVIGGGRTPSLRRGIIGALSGLAAGVLGWVLARGLVGASAGGSPWVLPAVVIGAFAVGLVCGLVFLPLISRRRSISFS